MRFRVLSLALCVSFFLKFDAGYAASDFFSECEGKQIGDNGSSINLTIMFNVDQSGRYAGTAEYFNARFEKLFEGKLKDIQVQPQMVNFDILYLGGKGKGSTIKLSLTRHNNGLRGTGVSGYSGKTRTVDVICK